MLGFGEHFLQVPVENLEASGLLSLMSGFFSILSSVCSKTSFATTLFRLSEGWMRYLILGIIISMNILMPLSALFLFVSCNPPAKNWKHDMPGTCWAPEISVVYGIVVGGSYCPCFRLFLCLSGADPRGSILGEL